MLFRAILAVPFAALGLRLTDEPSTALAFSGVALLVLFAVVAIEALRLSVWPAATAFGSALTRKINTFWK